MNADIRVCALEDCRNDGLFVLCAAVVVVAVVAAVTRVVVHSYCDAYHHGDRKPYSNLSVG